MSILFSCHVYVDIARPSQVLGGLFGAHALGPRPDGPRLRHVLWRLRCRGAWAGAGGRAQHLGDALGALDGGNMWEPSNVKR